MAVVEGDDPGPCAGRCSRPDVEAHPPLPRRVEEVLEQQLEVTHGSDLATGSGFFSRHGRSNGNRHEAGAMSWWIWLGPSPGRVGTHHRRGCR